MDQNLMCKCFRGQLFPFEPRPKVSREREKKIVHGEKKRVYFLGLCFSSPAESESGGLQAAQSITGGDITAAV